MDDELIMRDAKCSPTGRHMQADGMAYASRRAPIWQPAWACGKCDMSSPCRMMVYKEKITKA